MNSNSFSGRSLITSSDFTYDEMLYLFNLTRELKKVLSSGNKLALKRFRASHQEICAHTIFAEKSTRTQYSFLRALDFHTVNNSLFRVNPFGTEGSSFAKSESWADTINTLVGYSEHDVRNLFIIRSELEGACRWLQHSSAAYAQRHGLLAPVFINAGDGKHQHPTQELLDEFTFFEDNNWNNEYLHIALIGDLLHGRTVHSKVNGLKLFKNVIVDLVAPQEVQMPTHYIEQLVANGFQINFFGSIDEYIASGKIADRWYLTRPQLERLDASFKPIIEKIRSKIIFEKRHLDKINIDLNLYHPLPRYKEKPALPIWLNDHPFNAFERQSRNGRYVRIILVALLLGKLGHDFDGQAKVHPVYDENFIKSVDLADRQMKVSNEGINPVRKGVVLDHIGRGESPEVISEQVIKIRKILGINQKWYTGVAESRKKQINKGLLFLPGFNITESQIKILAAIEPGATLNIIKNRKVVKKLIFNLPERIYGIDQAACTNPDCISHPSHHEGVMPDFIRLQNGNSTFICRYCEQPHNYKEIWK